MSVACCSERWIGFYLLPVTHDLQAEDGVDAILKVSNKMQSGNAYTAIFMDSIMPIMVRACVDCASLNSDDVYLPGRHRRDFNNQTKIGIFRANICSYWQCIAR